MTGLRILSLGGGTQSCALALMSARGDLPRLDHVIFADTQGEMPETYAYLYWLSAKLAGAGIPLHIVTAGSLEAALLSAVPVSSASPSIPARTISVVDNSRGRVSGHRCSFDFKRRLVTRKTKQLCGGRGAWKRSDVEQWIGFSADEHSRCRPSTDCRCGHVAASHDENRMCTVCTRCEGFSRWTTNVWPLIALRMRRDDTIAWFAAHDYPTPPRSACFFCPNSDNGRWRALKADKPHLWDRAVRIDETVRLDGGYRSHSRTKFTDLHYLHRSYEPLAHADLRSTEERSRDAGQYGLWDLNDGAECQDGICFT